MILSHPLCTSFSQELLELCAPFAAKTSPIVPTFAQGLADFVVHIRSTVSQEDWAAFVSSAQPWGGTSSDPTFFKGLVSVFNCFSQLSAGRLSDTEVIRAAWTTAGVLGKPVSAAAAEAVPLVTVAAAAASADKSSTETPAVSSVVDDVVVEPELVAAVDDGGEEVLDDEDVDEALRLALELSMGATAATVPAPAPAPAPPAPAVSPAPVPSVSAAFDFSMLSQLSQAVAAAGVGTTASPAPAPAPTSWDCDVCTFQNQFSNSRCTMCGADKPASAASPAPQPPSSPSRQLPPSPSRREAPQQPSSPTRRDAPPPASSPPAPVSAPAPPAPAAVQLPPIVIAPEDVDNALASHTRAWGIQEDAQLVEFLFTLVENGLVKEPLGALGVEALHLLLQPNQSGSRLLLLFQRIKDVPPMELCLRLPVLQVSVSTCVTMALQRICLIRIMLLSVSFSSSMLLRVFC